MHGIGEAAAGSSSSGTVVLELGVGVGALVLRCPLELNGAEIDISQSGPSGHRTHAVVRPRHIAEGTVYAAVYPSLPAGDYTIWSADATPAVTVTVSSGIVTSAQWPNTRRSRMPSSAPSSRSAGLARSNVTS